MPRETKIRANAHLSPLPNDEQLLSAVAAGEDGEDRRWHYGITANWLAYELGVEGARRLGNGAVKGSWSGRMSGSLRVAPRLGSLVKRGLLASYYEGGRRYYTLTKAGRERLAVGEKVDEHGENMAPLNGGEASYEIGDEVTVSEGHEAYAGCVGVVKARGLGLGGYAGSVVYDVLIDGCVESERLREEELV